MAGLSREDGTGWIGIGWNLEGVGGADGLRWMSQTSKLPGGNSPNAAADSTHAGWGGLPPFEAPLSVGAGAAWGLCVIATQQQVKLPK